MALPEPGSVPVASATAPSQSPASSSPRICWWTEAYCDHGRGLRLGGRRVLRQLGELGVDGRVRGLPGLLERAARAAGDEGEALVRLGVEPGDAGLGRGQRGGVDAVAGGVDTLLDRQEPDRADHQGHEHHQRRRREREVDVAPGPSGQPDQGEPEHDQGEQARDDQPQGRSCGSVELLGDAGVVGLAQVLQQREGGRAQVGAGFLEVLRPDREGLTVVRPGLFDLARVGDERLVERAEGVPVRRLVLRGLGDRAGRPTRSPPV